MRSRFKSGSGIGIALNTKIAWLVYLLILIALAFSLIALMYLPLRKTKVWQKTSDCILAFTLLGIILVF